jgi:hypothetical protein
MASKDSDTSPFTPPVPFVPAFWATEVFSMAMRVIFEKTMFVAFHQIDRERASPSWSLFVAKIDMVEKP